MEPLVNLDIGLHYWGADRYAVNLRLTYTGNDADVRFGHVGEPMSRFDRSRFLDALPDLTEYGRRLGECVLSRPGALALFAKSEAIAEQLRGTHGVAVPLRVQLVLSPTMPACTTCGGRRSAAPRTPTGRCFSATGSWSRATSAASTAGPS